MPQFVGIVGGKPNFAYYFCGYIEKAIDDADPLHQLIFLDPHIVRDSTQSFTCYEPRTLHLTELDPCLSFGFLVRNEDDFHQLEFIIAESVQ